MATATPMQPAPVRRGVARAAVAAMRPAEWTKNVFVVAPLLFSGRFDDPTAARHTLVAFLAFCAMASAGYLLNDLRDVELDREHPTKRRRPIAAGELPIRTAQVLMVALALVAAVASTATDPELGAVVVGYGVLTAAYTAWLKHVVILDVMTIAGCFLMRILAGTVAAGAAASEWLIVCTGMLALFLGFTKRRQEAVIEMHQATKSRPVLEHYSLPFLDQMVSMVTAGTVISYAIYATDSPLVGSRMLWTAPMVVYGVFRYLYLIYDRSDDRSAASLVTRDVGMVLAAVAWVLVAALLIYT